MGQQLTGFHYRTGWIQRFSNNVKKLKFVDFLFIFLGITGVVFSVRRSQYAILTILLPKREKEFLNIAYERAKLKRGPKIVVVGGGTGLPNVLFGLKTFTSNLTAVVTVADDGGSSGRLRKHFNILPPGDIRNCIVALADQEDLLKDLFQYRFHGHGDLKGHSFGNLFITVMTEITGDFGRAVEESSKVLASRGTVMPVTFDSMTLQAKLANGKIITGETNISASKVPIAQLMLKETSVHPNKAVLKAILNADAIVLGPGSLFTSILPNLLVKEVSETIAIARAIKIYVCNVMTQPGETDAFRVSDHVRALLAHTSTNFIHYVLANKETVPSYLLNRYLKFKQEPVIIDQKEVESLGPKLVRANLLNRENFVRHSPEKLSKAIVKMLIR
jgi:uncharacterized cofD-like protein